MSDPFDSETRRMQQAWNATMELGKARATIATLTAERDRARRIVEMQKLGLKGAGEEIERLEEALREIRDRHPVSEDDLQGALDELEWTHERAATALAQGTQP
jgi:predicted  nucleic acid-binding Zn-ribbon protein